MVMVGEFRQVGGRAQADGTARRVQRRSERRRAGLDAHGVGAEGAQRLPQRRDLGTAQGERFECRTARRHRIGGVHFTPFDQGRQRTAEQSRAVVAHADAPGQPAGRRVARGFDDAAAVDAEPRQRRHRGVDVVAARDPVHQCRRVLDRRAQRRVVEIEPAPAARRRRLRIDGDDLEIGARERRAWRSTAAGCACPSADAGRRARARCRASPRTRRRRVERVARRRRDDRARWPWRFRCARGLRRSRRWPRRPRPRRRAARCARARRARAACPVPPHSAAARCLRRSAIARGSRSGCR